MLSSGQKFVRWGFDIRPRRRTVIAVTVALMLLPIEASAAGWLSDMFKGSSKDGKSPRHHVASRKAALARHAPSRKPHHVKLAALGPANLNALKPVASVCDPKKFRIVLDVGHTAESEGATSARNVPEFAFNLRLAQRIEQIEGGRFCRDQVAPDRRQG